MAVPPPPAARRGPGSAWNRLKTPTVDPLELYGLPSKGETRLNDFKLQETYYNRIVERYMKFCSNAGGGEELDRQFAALSVSPDSTPLLRPSVKQESRPTALPATPTVASNGLLSSKYASMRQDPPTVEHGGTSLSKNDFKSESSSTSSTLELQLILSAMRKLRESIIATHRHDNFAQRCYIFIIRACILTKSWESYHPALLYLLSTIHKRSPLGQSELREFVGYRVLDEACRVGDLAEAQRIRVLWNRQASVKVVDPRVEAALSSLAHDNWHHFWRVRRAVDGYQRALMGWAEDGMRLHALKCLGRGYLKAERCYIESCTCLDWTRLVQMGVGWELQDDGRTVVIRRPKIKS